MQNLTLVMCQNQLISADLVNGWSVTVCQRACYLGVAGDISDGKGLKQTVIPSSIRMPHCIKSLSSKFYCHKANTHRQASIHTRERWFAEKGCSFQTAWLDENQKRLFPWACLCRSFQMFTSLLWLAVNPFSPNTLQASAGTTLPLSPCSLLYEQFSHWAN